MIAASPAPQPTRRRRSPRRRDPKAYRPYPSDLTDEQWQLIAPMVPEPDTQGPGSGGGGQVIHERRRILEAILYINRAGCAWRMLPHDFPTWETVYWYFERWTTDGTLDRIHDALRDGVRDAAGRDPMASAGAVDSQSAKSADTVGAGTGSRGTTAGDVRGWDGGKKIDGRKRHLVVDTMGLLIVVMVTSASVQDRDGGIRVLSKAKTAMPSLVKVWADGAYSKRCSDFAARALRILVETVSKIEGQKGFVPLPRRWVIERTNGWLLACRRLARDDERLHTHAEAMVKWSMVGVMVRRLAPAAGRKPWQRSVTTSAA